MIQFVSLWCDLHDWLGIKHQVSVFSRSMFSCFLFSRQEGMSMYTPYCTFLKAERSNMEKSPGIAFWGMIIHDFKTWQRSIQVMGRAAFLLVWQWGYRTCHRHEKLVHLCKNRYMSWCDICVINLSCPKECIQSFPSLTWEMWDVCYLCMSVQGL